MVSVLSCLVALVGSACHLPGLRATQKPTPFSPAPGSSFPLVLCGPSPFFCDIFVHTTHLRPLWSVRSCWATPSYHHSPSLERRTCPNSHHGVIAAVEGRRGQVRQEHHAQDVHKRQGQGTSEFARDLLGVVAAGGEGALRTAWTVPALTVKLLVPMLF